MVSSNAERQCCRSSIEHIAKRFFVLRRILDTEEKTLVSPTTRWYVNIPLIIVEVEYAEELLSDCAHPGAVAVC